MNCLVKILSSDDGEVRIDPVWCLISPNPTGAQTLCQGEFFGYGESGCEYETKEVKKGGITCPRCIDHIKQIKAVKL